MKPPATGSPILPSAARYLLPLLLLFAVFLMLRGHDRPGGAFVGGLVAVAGFALIAIASGADAARVALRVEPKRLISAGFLVAVGSGLLPLLFGLPALSAGWQDVRLPGGASLHVGTPIIFEVGVFLIVLGAGMTAVMLLAEERFTPRHLAEERGLEDPTDAGDADPADHADDAP
jgi:multicomponent Na+:H+ antiporter subunit B